MTCVSFEAFNIQLPWNWLIIWNRYRQGNFEEHLLEEICVSPTQMFCKEICLLRCSGIVGPFLWLRTSQHEVRSEGFTAFFKNITVCWHVTLCCLVILYLLFGGASCRRLAARRKKQMTISGTNKIFLLWSMQTGFGFRPASYAVGTGFFSWHKDTGAWSLTPTST